MTDILQKRDKLLSLIESFESCAVAFSGGVDSAVVAKAAFVALGKNSVAVTGLSPSVASGEVELASEVARNIGIRHQIIETHEFDNTSYVENQKDRCFHCKNELYGLIGGMSDELGVSMIANGANLDDAADYRPGMRAADEHRVRSPLADCGFTKADVRALAKHWRLEVAEKPASPCLASRVAYGEEVTPQRLDMIDRAEQHLRALGLQEVRVRYHRGDLARVEVPVSMIAQLSCSPLREELAEHFQSIGFRYVTIDLQGFRSGSLNELIQIDSPADR